MALPMVAPELYRPQVDFPNIPYDHLLRMAADRFPERQAIIYHKLVLTYREVVSMVNCLANGLLQLGLSKGDHLCTFITNRPEYPILLNAAATIGAVLSPINPAFKERELSYQLADSEAKAILVQRELLPLLQAVMREETFPHLKLIIVTEESVPEDVPGAIPFARLLRESSAKRPAPAQIGGDDLLALPYSSGTTGLPKGVMLSHRNLATNHLQFLTASRISSVDTTLIFLPLYHIYGVLLTGSFLAAGATQVLMERFCQQQVGELQKAA